MNKLGRLSSFVVFVWLAGCAIPTIAWSQTSTASVNVDFGAPQTVKSASGLLFGTTPSTQAAQLAPIQPRLWRFAAFSDITSVPPGPYHSWSALASAFGTIVPDVTRNLLLGQAYGFPSNNWNGVNQPPWQDWAYYENHLTTLVRTLRDGGLTGVWEVWNEPDHPDFWSGTDAQFNELYRRAYTIIRTELGPNVDVAGPSFSTYGRAKIEAFLEFCLANGCEVNALVFHALDSSPAGLAAASANMRDARTAFMDNPRYAPLKIRRLLINELGGSIYTRQPAGTLAHHAAFEAGGADAAARACWRNSANRSECYNGSLGGLLTETTLEPRSVWWAHK
jgi:xylan 1,4-beta-xylosidase